MQENYTEHTLETHAMKKLLDLIDNFAEMRHTQGHWTYNLKSHDARNAVIAAIKSATCRD